MESILLGIPIPNVFIFQRPDGVWDVIDGLQRLSTIFEFAGELRDEEDKVLPSIQLAKTRYLPSLEGRFWESINVDQSLTDAQRRLIKRSKIDLKIVKNDSSQTSKFELFDRLNTGGTQASDQEVRNCLLIMANRPMFYWTKTLAADANFIACTALSNRQLEERYDLELVLRFVAFVDLPDDSLGFEEIGTFLTDRMLQFASGETRLNQKITEEAFKSTFRSLVESSLIEDAFRKYDWKKQKFVGAFSISSYEAVSLGLGSRFKNNPHAATPQNLRSVVQEIWQNSEFLDSSGSGVRASTRIPRIVPLGRKLLA